jgi:hypothetical protein
MAARKGERAQPPNVLPAASSAAQGTTEHVVTTAQNIRSALIIDGAVSRGFAAPIGSSVRDAPD